MGRKSLLASTTKKKATGKKKTTSKKSVKAKAAEKATKNEASKTKTKAATAQKKAVKAATPRKKSTASKGKKRPSAQKTTKATARVTKTGAAKQKAPTKKKAPAAKKKKATLKGLLFKQFVSGKGAAKAIKVRKQVAKVAEAPAFVSGYDKKETERIRGLLFQQFDLTAPEAVEKIPAKKERGKAKPATKKKKETLKDLLFKQFVSGKGAARAIKVRKQVAKVAEAPAFVSGYDKKETERIRGLLFQQFDLTAPEAAMEAPAKKAAVKAKSPVKKASAGEKRAVTLKDLLFKEFESETPIIPITVDKAVADIGEAPPFFSGYDQEETEKLRAVLFKAFDLKAEVPGKRAEEAASKPTPTVASPQVRPHEPDSCAESAEKERTGKAMRMGLCALALLVAIIVGTSFSNRGKFYLREVDNGVEVWRGKFAPAGTELVYKLDGAAVPNPLRESYSQKEISPILFGYFLDKADTVLNVPAGPDIPKMKEYLRQAAAFAPSMELNSQIQRRLKGVDFVVAFYRADVALSKGTAPDLRAAKSSLAKAYSSATTDSQRELVTKTQAVVDRAMAAMKTE